MKITLLLIFIAWPALASSRILNPYPEALQNDKDGNYAFQNHVHKFHKVMTNLLDVKDPTSDHKHPTAYNSQHAAAEYMRELYETNISFPYDATLRNILPYEGMLNGKQALVFDLNKITDNEMITKAEIHFYPPTKVDAEKHKSLKHIFSAKVLEIPHLMSHENATIIPMTNMRLYKRSLIWDVTNIAQKIKHAGKNRIIVQFLRNYRLMMNQFVLNRCAPFLFVQTKNLHQETLNNGLSSERENSKNSNKFKRSKRSTDYATYYTYNHDNDVNDKEFKLLKHDMYMYQTPDHDRRRSDIEKIVKQGPSMLTARLSRRRKHKHRKNHNKKYKNDPMMGFGMAEDENLTTKKTDRPILPVNNTDTQSCKRLPFTVDFAEIGWQNVIIAPRSFNAYYCAGTCDYPTSMGKNPANHAILQSIFNTINRNSNIPKVCCSPEKLDSLTILFYDDNGNVVLKNYPRMIVSSCSCL